MQVFAVFFAQSSCTPDNKYDLSNEPSTSEMSIGPKLHKRTTMKFELEGEGGRVGGFENIGR